MSERWSEVTDWPDGFSECSAHKRLDVQWKTYPPDGFPLTFGRANHRPLPCPSCFPAWEDDYLERQADAGGPVGVNGREFAVQPDGSWLYTGSARLGVMGDAGTTIRVLPA